VKFIQSEFILYFLIDRSMIDDFMTHRPHTIDGRQTESKRALPRDEASKLEGQLTVKKIFIGGIKEKLTEEELK
jgi:heterogeneous nuclear ribonucleoprotein A1/A3